MTAETDMLAATVNDGGGTFEAGTFLPFRPADGYAVATGGVTLDPKRVDAERLGQLARAVTGEWGESYIGTWIADDILYVDAVRYVRNRSYAINLARQHGQIAVYDFGTQQAVLVETEVM